MDVIGWNRSPVEAGFPLISRQEVLERSDVLSLHTSLAPETRHLVGGEEIACMKDGALLVNTARGALMDREALIVALDTGKIAGYAADGLEDEPPTVGDLLIHYPRPVITPHAAALTGATYRRLCQRTVANVLAVLAGANPNRAASPMPTRCRRGPSLRRTSASSSPATWTSSNRARCWQRWSCSNATACGRLRCTNVYYINPR